MNIEAYGIGFKHRTWLSNLFLILSDLVGFAVSFVLIILVRKYVFGVENDLLFDSNVRRTLYFVVIISILIFLMKGLYPGRGRISVIELKQVSEAIFTAYALVSVYIFIDSRLTFFSRSIYLLSGVIGIGTITFGRILTRKFIINTFDWWGEPVFIIGNMAGIENVVTRLYGCKRLGFRPVIAMSLDNGVVNQNLGAYSDIKFIPWLPEEEINFTNKQINTVILAISISELKKKSPTLYRSLFANFQKIIFMLDQDIYSLMMSQTIDLNGHPAVLSHQSVQYSAYRIQKYIIEIILLILFFFPILFIAIIASILIKIDSKGPIFYSQERVGKNLIPIKILKFRTMFVNSSEILDEILKDPQIKEEWETFHKIKNDPRITRIGKLLRKFSIDELPQFVNVLRGEMSITGPRPLTQDEIEKIGEEAKVIFKAKPGITGWWQVNGRNNLTFDERTSLDLYYVYNWSVWLDIFITLKTFWVVLFAKN